MNKRLRKKKGIYTKFKDREIWDLYTTIAKFTLPRLIAFKKRKQGLPMILLLNDQGVLCEDMEFQRKGNEKWNNILDQIIWSFEQIVNDSDPEKLDGESPEEYWDRLVEWTTKIQTGLDLFGKYFRCLWW